MSTRTELVGVETLLGNIDVARALATIIVQSRYNIYRTTYRTIYRTITYSIVSEKITEIIRTYTLAYGNIRTVIVSRTPTEILLRVYTLTIDEQGARNTGRTPTPTPQPTPTPVQAVYQPSPSGEDIHRQVEALVY